LIVRPSVHPLRDKERQEGFEDDTGDTAPAAIEIAPSPVIEPDPRFFAGAGGGSNGYYPKRPAR
jgi:hypothetical protein